jgi:cell division protein ZipA
VDNLRLILILIGIAILALIVLLHRPAGETRRNHARWREANRERREPRLGDDVDDYVDDRPAMIHRATGSRLPRCGTRI